jgi:hypothetical protein
MITENKPKTIYDQIRSNKEKYKIKYLVTSHASYYQIALPTLISSMIDQISPGDILVVIGGMNETRSEILDGIEFQLVEYNCMDHTGFTFLAEHWGEYKNKADYWFNLHDTCQAGPFFGELVYNFPDGINTYAASSGASSNLGLYKSTWIESKIPQILSNKEEFKRIGNSGAIVFEDTLWTHPKQKGKPAYNDIDSLNRPGMGDKLIQAGCENGYTQAYSQDTKLRRAICYRTHNLYKFKSQPNVAAQGV